MRLTEKKIVEWAREHKIGTKVFGLTISQYVQDENGVVYVAIPIKEIIKRDGESGRENSL